MSWFQSDRNAYQPTSWPSSILGWWCDGWRSRDEHAILCAHVEAVDRDAAVAIIGELWGEVKEWRELREVWAEWFPLSARYPYRPH